MKNQIYLMCFLLSLHMTMFAQRQSYYKMQDGTTIFLERVDSLNYVKFKTQTAVTQRSRVLQKYNSSLSSSNTSYSMVRINNTLDLQLYLQQVKWKKYIRYIVIVTEQF